MEKKNRTATDKIKRVLDIYTRLTNGDIIDKSALAVEYNVNERSIQRDIEDILADKIILKEINPGDTVKISVDSKRKELTFKI